MLSELALIGNPSLKPNSAPGLLITPSLQDRSLRLVRVQHIAWEVCERFILNTRIEISRRTGLALVICYQVSLRCQIAVPRLITMIQEYFFKGVSFQMRLVCVLCIEISSKTKFLSSLFFQKDKNSCELWSRNKDPNIARYFSIRL